MAGTGVMARPRRSSVGCAPQTAVANGRELRVPLILRGAFQVITCADAKFGGEVWPQALLAGYNLRALKTGVVEFLPIFRRRRASGAY